MPFPTTGYLDQFNSGANQALTGRAGWSSSVLRTGDATLTTDAVPTTAVAAATAGNLWNDPACPDSECWLTIAAYVPASQQIYTCARVTSQGSLTCYALQIGSPASTFTLLRFVAGAGTAIGSSQGITCAVGDSVGISVIGNVVTSYYQPSGGSWSQKDQQTDGNVTGQGKYGGFFCSSGVAIDAIGGGQIFTNAGQRTCGAWITSSRSGG